MTSQETEDRSQDIAIIGMAGRFPGARTVDEFWMNLRNGVESIAFFSDQQLLAAGVEQHLIHHPNYVKASGILADIEMFDATFFGYSPREAEVMDPQHRVFLECAWEALENAGYKPEAFAGRIGVFAGAGLNSYWLHNLKSNPDLCEAVGDFAISLGNEKDFLSTRVSYKLNLTGPSFAVNTACSTSLVAVHVACQNLLMYQCDLALAGGVGIHLPQDEGYMYQEGMVMSPDGHCRAFDAAAQGTVGGNGAGLVVLKRLEDALADRDCIAAVIQGSAINNDGAHKVGYTAPSLEGQADVIAEAQFVAGVDPETITYIECHGTGTPLGDPIELAALTKAFRSATPKRKFCAIGAVKSNIGHLDTAAGIAGLIKTVLALQHKSLPPSLHFTRANPQIDFESSPFYVNTALSEWTTNGAPRRAGVSSFGIGGTNAHVILEEAPVATHELADSNPPTGTRPQLLVLSAKTSTALDAMTKNLANRLGRDPNCNLADVAYTLSMGRRAFNHRRVLVCDQPDAASAALRSLDAAQVSTNVCGGGTPRVIFMFSGQGSQYVNMGRDLYRAEPVFREQVDLCCDMLAPHLALDLRSVLYPPASEHAGAATQLQQTALTQPALFVIEFALAKLWESWGLRPQAAIGHSIGEYVAATLAGVFELEDALALVAARGQMMQQLPGGSMLAVPLSEVEIQSLLHEELAVAAINGPSLCVVSGPTAAIQALQAQLAERNLPARLLTTSHAFHGPMMEPVLRPFADRVKEIQLHAPQLPYLSNVTGTWITAAEATDPEYWARHLRAPVRFADGLQKLLQEPGQVLLEVGPGRTLSTLARRHPNKTAEHEVLTSLPHPPDSHPPDSRQPDRDTDVAFALTTLGKLWLNGVDVDWSGFYAGQNRSRIPLPTYPFERQRYWIDYQKPSDRASQNLSAASQPSGKRPNVADWFYIPSWKRVPLLLPHQEATASDGNLLLFADDCGLADRLAQRLATGQRRVVVVKAGSSYAKHDDSAYTIRPGQPADYDRLLDALGSASLLPDQIVHLWSVTKDGDVAAGLEQAAQIQDRGFYSLLFLAQAIGKQNLASPCQLLVISNNLHDVAGETELCAEKATVLGPLTVIPQEFPNVTCRGIDIVLPTTDRQQPRLTDQLAAEFASQSDDAVIAYRGTHRWVQTFEPVQLESPGEASPRVRHDGVYLITGGLGGIGLVLAEHLAKAARAKLILVGRSEFPDRADWEAWLATHPEHDRVSRKIRTLQGLEELGAEVLVIRADVTNEHQMQQAINLSLRRFGQINGVIHAAGLPGAGVIQRKTRELAEQTLGPKVQGTLILDRLLQGMELDWFVLCSSLTAVLGGIGQVDYCGANAFLDAFAHQKANEASPFTVAIDWDAWLEVGMAKEAALRFGTGAALAPGHAVDHPLLDHCSGVNDERSIYSTTFRVDSQWVLNEHRVAGTPTLPATAYLEMARAALENQVGREWMEFRDVFLLRPMMVGEEEEREVRTSLTKREGGWQFSISSLEAASASWHEHARGTIIELKEPAPKQYDLAVLQQRCNAGDAEKPDQDAQLQKGRVAAGPRWHTFQQGRRASDQALALLELPAAFVADIDIYKLHPALLDGATSFLTATTGEDLYLPFCYEKIKIHGPLPRRIYSYIRSSERRQKSEDTLSFDIAIMDERGKAIVEIEEYTLRRLANEARDNSATHPAAAPPVEREPASVFAEQRQQTLREGLLSAEGADVFHRIISRSLPQVLVSTQDFDFQIKQSREGIVVDQRQEPKSRDGARKSPRSTTTPYVAPRDELEETLAQVWQDFLSIDRVGIHDDFFELGGDSLLAIQLAADLNERLSTNVSPNNLLSSPTIAKLSAVFSGTNGSVAGADRKSAAVSSSSLVEIHAGSRDNRPLFLIHPVGGSVYCYRELGQNLGDTQPVYALQSQGLDGEGEPLVRVEQMAAHYLSLLRKVQPQGPYQLGGWSLGGLVAFEMARQLREQGQELSLLAMIDTFAPHGTDQLGEAELSSNFASYIGAVAGQELSVSVDELRPLSSEEQLQLILQRAKTHGVLPPEMGADQMRNRLQVFQANFQAMDNYRPQPSPQQLTLFCADESVRETDDDSLGWRSVAVNRVTAQTIPGDHYSIVNSQLLRDKLRACLQPLPV